MKLFSRSAVAFLVLAAAFMLPKAAHADPLVTYVVTGTFASGGTLSGYFTLDTDPWLPTPVVTDAQLTADGMQFGCPDGYPNGCMVGNGLTTNDQFMVGPGPNNSILEIAWPMDESGTLTLTASNTYCESCGGDSNWPDYLVSGTAVDPPNFYSSASVATPEPSSAALLLSGLFGLAFIGWQSRRALQF